MSRHFGQQALDVLSIRGALNYCSKRSKSYNKNTQSKKSTNDPKIVCILTQLPYVIRTVKNDEHVYSLVINVHRIYNQQLLFTARLPLPLLVHYLIQLYVPEYASYSSKLLDANANYDRYNDTWALLSSELQLIKPVAVSV